MIYSPSLRAVASMVVVAAMLGLLMTVPAIHAQTGGKVNIYYDQTDDAAQYHQLALELRKLGIFEQIAAFVGATVALPSDLTVGFSACGTGNAFYLRQRKIILMCYELFEGIHDMFDKDMNDEQIGLAMLGAGSFILLHEIGHALVDILQIPITGREEDAVDDLASIILIEEDATGVLEYAIVFWMTLGEKADAKNLAFWDEHSLSKQRGYQLACNLYGSDPQRYHSELVGPDRLPPERAQKCRREYQQKLRSWNHLLADHMR